VDAQSLYFYWRGDNPDRDKAEQVKNCTSEVVMDSKQHICTKLNLGCGPIQPKGWINIDGSNRAWLASRFNSIDRLLVKLGILPKTEFNSDTKFVNLVKGLPFRDGAVDFIYAGELWEHIEHKDALELAKDCCRVLRQGGVLRICVPDGPFFGQNTSKSMNRKWVNRPTKGMLSFSRIIHTCSLMI